MHCKSRENTVVDLFVSIAHNAAITTQSNRDLFISPRLFRTQFLASYVKKSEREREGKEERKAEREGGREEGKNEKGKQ